MRRLPSAPYAMKPRLVLRLLAALLAVAGLLSLGGCFVVPAGPPGYYYGYHGYWGWGRGDRDRDRD